MTAASSSPRARRSLAAITPLDAIGSGRRPLPPSQSRRSSPEHGSSESERSDPVDPSDPLAGNGSRGADDGIRTRDPHLGNLAGMPQETAGLRLWRARRTARGSCEGLHPTVGWQDVVKVSVVRVPRCGVCAYTAPMATTKPETRDERLHLRLSPTDDGLIRAAAEAAHLSLTEFVVQAARASAAQVLADRDHVVLDADAWALLEQRLAKKGRRKPTTAEVFSRPSPFER